MVDVEQLVLTPEEDEAAGDVLYGVSIGRLSLSALDEFSGRPELVDAVARARRCGEQVAANEKAKREDWEAFLASLKPKVNFRRRIGGKKGASFILPESFTKQPEAKKPSAQTAPCVSESTIEKIVAEIPIQARQLEKEVQEDEQPKDRLYVLDRKAPLDNAKKLITARHYDKANKVRTLRFWQQQFWTWERDHWKAKDQNTVRKEVYDFLDKSQKELKAGRLDRFEPTSHDVNQVIDAMKAVADLEPEWEMPGWFGEPRFEDLTEIIPCRNGLLYLPTRELIPHTPKFWSPNVLEFEYQPGAKAPRFEKFLVEVWPRDPSARQSLLELFGLCMTDITKYQKMWMFVGPQRGGRGTIGRVLQGLVGRENFFSSSLRQLGTEFGMENFVAKKVVMFPDARVDGIRRDVMNTITERLLSITGEDNISINRKHIKFWNGTLRCRMIIFSNELLRLREDSGALAGRFIIQRMDQSFRGREDTELTPKLLAERPGILNLCLDALDELRSRGRLIQPGSGLEMSESLEDITSDVTTFVHERCVIGAEHEILCDNLFKAYEAWCFNRNIRIGWGSNVFSEKVRAAVPTITKSRPRDGAGRPTMLLGIGLRKKERVE